MIKVLLIGEHRNFYKDGYYTINPLTSSVTLIKIKNHNILVDTGALFYSKKIIKALGEEGLEPKDIDIIFNTHYHLDHTSNNHFFVNAKIYVGNGMLDLKTGICTIYMDLNKRKLPKGLEILQTPGHTKSHFSVVYKEDGKTYAAAGDAVREDFLTDKNLPWSSEDNKTFIQSMKKVFDIADVIIPGHGEIIEGERMEKLRKLLRKRGN